MLKVFLQDESGATAIEYGVIAVVLTLAIVSAAGAVGTALDQLYSVAPEGMAQAQITTYNQ